MKEKGEKKYIVTIYLRNDVYTNIQLIESKKKAEERRDLE